MDRISVLWFTANLLTSSSAWWPVAAINQFAVSFLEDLASLKGVVLLLLMTILLLYRRLRQLENHVEVLHFSFLAESSNTSRRAAIRFA